MSIFIQDLHLNFHSFLGFRHGSGSSVKAIMPLSATWPLTIGLKCFWFLIVNRTWIIFPWFLRSLPTKPVFEKISTKAFCQYIPTLMSKKKLGSFNDLINAFFQSLICLARYERFLFSIFCKVSLALLNKIQPILERLK